MSRAREFVWRDWPAIFSGLPSLEGATVLDVGCGVGDQTAELLLRGARVVGLDIDEEQLVIAQSRALVGAEFRVADLRSPLDGPTLFNGIWCSFTAAYLCDFEFVARNWATHLEPGGWIAVTEVDDLFGHEPLPSATAKILEAYVDDAWSAQRYDFRMGSKLASHLTSAGYALVATREVPDAELSFDGPAPDDVALAWERRLDRMILLHQFCPDFARVRADFLRCLNHDEHRSRARVITCLALKPDEQRRR